jgi:type III secretion system YscJ/HrcJ family lipoprotein
MDQIRMIGGDEDALEDPTTTLHEERESQKMGCTGRMPKAFCSIDTFSAKPISGVLFLSLLFSISCTGDLDIVHGMTELEANEVLVVLDTQGIDAHKEKEEGRVVTWAVIVPDAFAESALRILVRNKLPKPRSIGLAEVYPAGSGGLIPTKSEEKAKYLMAIQGEIERKLKTLPGIVQAHVSVVLPDKDVVRDLEAAPSSATASVAVVYNLQENGEAPVGEKEVQTLVAAAVEDLKPENVMVILKENRPMFLVDMEGEAENTMANATTAMFGIKVVSEEAAAKVSKIIVPLLVMTVVGLALALVGILRALSFRRKWTKAQAEVAALKKAGREIQE